MTVAAYHSVFMLSEEDTVSVVVASVCLFVCLFAQNLRIGNYVLMNHRSD